jgi:L-asparaginase
MGCLIKNGIQMNQQGTILILGMGGTIAGLAANPDKDPLNYAAGQLSIGDLIKSTSAGSQLQFQSEQIANINSCDLSEELLSRLGNRVREALNDPAIKGVVITHGTDTIEETGIFLHLTCGALAQKHNKTVALTGAMLPSNAPNADGPANLALAISAATGHVQINDQTVILPGGIVGAFAGRLIAAKHYGKRFSARIDAPVADSPELGSVGLIADTLNPKRDLPIPDSEAWPWVELITSHAGAKSQVLDFIIENSVQGLVIAGTGQGNINQGLLTGLQKAKNSGIPMIRSTRTGKGEIRQNIPMNDDQLGTQAAGYLTPPQARIALQLLIHASRTDKSLDWKNFFATIAGLAVQK